MNGLARNTPPSNQPLTRDQLFALLEAAVRTGELRFARRLCTAWLVVFPGDLHVKLYHARAFYREPSDELKLNALPILEEICMLDPEFLEAQELLAEVRHLAGSSDHQLAKACANALSHGREINTGKNTSISSWAKYVYEARNALNDVRSGDYQQIEKAEHFIHKALVENPDTPLAAVIHLRLLESKGSMPKMAVRSLAEIYHERWPDCLQFQLTLSSELMESGESSQAVSMLHQAVSRDIAGQVPRRMWGENHQYASLWPARLVASHTGPNSPQNIPIPAAVASSMGWNQIPAMTSGEDGFRDLDDQAFVWEEVSEYPDASKTQYAYVPHEFQGEGDVSSLSEPAQAVQTELERLADELKRPHVVRDDGRFPIYVIFSTRGGLDQHYGPSGFQVIDEELMKLAKLVHGHKINQEYWGSLVFYADDPISTRFFDLNPAAYNDAWQLKQILADLDAALEKRGERIGALLIVGGPEVVPFHNLPNPVEDADNQVPSDNPYSTRDSNYFISDWPVGRISGGSGSDPTQLLKIIKEISQRYDPEANKFVWYQRFLQYIQELLRRGISKKQSSFGYTAAVWRRASLSVFQSIGVANDLLVSPPTHTCMKPSPLDEEPVPLNGNGNHNSCLLLPRSRLGYFNLHGVPDGSEWYGQCDPTVPGDGPDFPVAMRPEDIQNSGSAPHMVFTEACYGANIIDKAVGEAIALKFIASGTHAVVGSTCISYGSLATPLTSADLLGRVFWSHLQEGFPAGESLRRAKIHLTREMHQRQGFLDAEDQKTLISFLLIGDPLAQPFVSRTSPKVAPHLSDAAVPVPTVCEHDCGSESELPVSIETISHLKSVVSQYLPGMNDADVSLRQERQACSNTCGHCSTGKKCTLSQSGGKRPQTIKHTRRVVTLSKNYQQAKYTHRQYARLTLDEAGQIVKMVVSH